MKLPRSLLIGVVALMLVAGTGMSLAAMNRESDVNGQVLWSIDATLTDDDQTSIVALDPATGTEVSRFKAGRLAGSWSLALSGDGRTAWLANYSNGDVAVVDVQEKKPIKEIALNPGVNEGPNYVRLSRDGSRAFVTTTYGGQLFVIDTADRKILHKVELGSPVEGLAVSEDGRTAYVGNYSRDRIDIVDVEAGRRTGSMPAAEGDAPRRVTLSPDGEKLYAANYYGKSVAVYDLKRPKSRPHRIQVGGMPRDLTIDGGGEHLYVSNTGRGLSVVDTATLKAEPIPVSDGWGALALSEDGRTLYLVESGDKGRLTVVDTGSRKVTARSGVPLSNAYDAVLAPLPTRPTRTPS